MLKVKTLIESRMQTTGIQTKYRKYDEPPGETYATWYVDSEDITGSDNSHRIRTSEIVLELHTVEKDFESEEIIEAAFEDFHMQKQEDYNETENLCIITYNFTLVTKIKRRQKNG